MFIFFSTSKHIIFSRDIRIFYYFQNICFIIIVLDVKNKVINKIINPVGRHINDKNNATVTLQLVIDRKISLM